MTLDDLPRAFALTIIHQIAMLLLKRADGDMVEAKRAALITIKSHDPRNEIEFQLAARIISFSLQAMQALAQAANPDLSVTRVLRLRSGAVSLNRQAHKAELQLEKLRKAQTRSVEPKTPTRSVEPASPPAPEPVTHRVAQPEAPQAATREAPRVATQEAPPADETAAPIGAKGKIAAYARAHGLAWSQGLQKRNRQKRLAERQAKMARRAAVSQVA